MIRPARLAFWPVLAPRATESRTRARRATPRARRRSAQSVLQLVNRRETEQPSICGRAARRPRLVELAPPRRRPAPALDRPACAPGARPPRARPPAAPGRAQGPLLLASPGAARARARSARGAEAAAVAAGAV